MKYNIILHSVLDVIHKYTDSARHRSTDKHANYKKIT